MSTLGWTLGKYYARLSCGHYGSLGEDCEECRYEGPSPDLWEVAGEDINLNRKAETRAYRQSKFRR
jgi:hypothetical protein